MADFDLFLVHVFSCMFSRAALAQLNSAPRQSDDSESHLITLYVIASNSSGQPISGLTERDFTVLDNTQPQKLVSFRAVEGPTAGFPGELALVVDEVNNSLVNVAYAKNQVAKFLRTNGGRLPMPVSLAFFTDSGVTIGGEPSTDGSVLLAELNQDRTPLHTILRSQGAYGENDRFELSLLAIEQLIGEEASRPGRKLMVWISPGWPFLSESNDIACEISTCLADVNAYYVLSFDAAAGDGPK